MRVALSLCFCAATLGAGVLATCLAARNRARASELDADQRWFEAFSRYNELLRTDVQEEEWRLLTGLEPEPVLAVPTPGKELED